VYIQTGREMHGVHTDKPTDCMVYIQTGLQSAWCTFRQADTLHGVHTDRATVCMVYTNRLIGCMVYF
jgi:hypothetical protein